MVCVVLVRQFGFRRLVAALSYVWVIRMAKQIQSDKDIKSNHGHQYVAKLKSYVFNHHRIIKYVKFKPSSINLDVASSSRFF